jgi:hypothetical protein
MLSAYLDQTAQGLRAKPIFFAPDDKGVMRTLRGDLQ